MPLRTSIKKLNRRDPADSLRERSAELRDSLPRTVTPQVVPTPTANPSSDAGGTLPRIAQHRIARDHWNDTLKPADRVWRKQHGLDTSTEAVAAAEAERNAADDAVTEAWNSLFATRPASSAELLALLRHAQHYVDEDHAPDAAIELSGMVRAIGDAVEALRTQPLPDFEAEAGTTSPDRFLIDLAPTLLPLLDEADVEWARVHVLYEQAVAACGTGPGPGMSETALQAYRDKFDVALTASGYRADWEAVQPLYERIEALVGPLMNVPVQTLEGLILKQRIGQTLSHFEDDAAKDLGRLVKAYRPGEPVPRASQISAPPRFQGGLVDQIDFANASLDDLRSLHGIAGEVSTFAYALVWTGRCHARGWNKTGNPAGQHNAAGRLMQWLGDALTDVESAAADEARRRVPVDSSERETRLSMLTVTTINNGDPDEIEALARELLAHAEAERTGS